MKMLDKNKVYYMACPYTSFKETQAERVAEQHERAEEITRIAAEITHRHGLVVLGPITTSHHFKRHVDELGTSWDFWKSIDTKLLERCTDAVIVAMMPGYTESVGVREEVEIALNLNIPVYYLNPETLELEYVEIRAPDSPYRVYRYDDNPQGNCKGVF